VRIPIKRRRPTSRSNRPGTYQRLLLSAHQLNCDQQPVHTSWARASALGSPSTSVDDTWRPHPRRIASRNPRLKQGQETIGPSVIATLIIERCPGSRRTPDNGKIERDVRPVTCPRRQRSQIRILSGAPNSIDITEDYLGCAGDWLGARQSARKRQGPILHSLHRRQKIRVVVE
jgi:hypothetical protein